ncbi:MAG: hypothetical protein KA149_12390 [Chitinophagales bacterium]|nr:hypothetical protein [Chitinophagales bacterium]
MKTTALKTTALFFCLSITAVKAQNTSIGIPSGSYKDTSVTYKEDPEKHAHTTTTVISNDKGNGKVKNIDGSGDGRSGGGEAEMQAPLDNASATPTEPAYNSTSTTETTTSTETAEMCSCDSLHIAYGVAGAGILGTLIFLALYLNEKNKDKNQNRA